MRTFIKTSIWFSLSYGDLYKVYNPAPFPNTFLDVLFKQMSLLRHSDFGAGFGTDFGADFGAGCCVLWNVSSSK